MPNEVIRMELTLDPANKGYAGKTHAQMETLINSADIWQNHVAAETDRILWEMGRAGTWAPLVAKIDDALATAAVRNTARSFRDFVLHKPRFPTETRAGYDAFGAMLGVLQNAGVMTVQQRNTLLALGDQFFSRANLIGYGYVDQPMIADALAG